MDTIRCPACIGTKTIMGLGMIVKDCEHCNGVGYVKENLNQNHENEQAEIKIFKPRGRPKKVD